MTNSFHDTHANAQLITQGQFAVGTKPDSMIKTLLGSCVSVCLWDETAGVGGMNHLLLAGKSIGNEARYDVAGVAEMECLINGIIKKGGRKERLNAKVFGGAKMLDSPTLIGEKNIKFAFDFLEQEKIPCINSSVGGDAARALRFWPNHGRVNMRFVKEAPPISLPAAKPKVAAGNDLELF